MTGVIRNVSRWWRTLFPSDTSPTSNAIAAEYQAWRNRFLRQRLHLWLWLVLIRALTFTFRNIYSFFFPLQELQRLPPEVRRFSVFSDAAVVVSLLACFVLYRTKFARRHPGLLVVIISWSLSLIQQIFATIRGFAAPDLIAWTLLFVSQAIVIPVRWRLHLISQLGLLVYYFGVNTALGLTTPIPERPEIYTVTIVLYLFWLCAICDIGVYLYDRLQRSEFYARRELETAYQRLGVAEAKYRNIFENAVEGIFQSSPDGRYVTANPALARIFGYSSSEEVIQKFTDIENQLYVNPRRRAEFTRQIEENGGVSEFESQVYRQDGSIVWISEKAYAVRDENGKLLYYEGLIEDITKRKQAEAALQEQLNFLQVLIDTIPTPVFYKNAQGLYVGCNTAFQEALGLSKEQILGKTVYDIAPKELADKYYQADMVLFEQLGVQTYETSIVYGDGIKHDVIFFNATFSKADGTLGGVVGVILDISERKRTEEALRVFFHAVSHDLRNPVLGTLMVLKNLLSQGAGSGNQQTEQNSSQSLIPVARSILERMKQSSERQLNLINSLMETQINEVQGVVMQRQALKLHALVEATAGDLQSMLTENQAILTNLISADLPLVNADPTQMWRVYSNLIVNAIKHNPPGLSITLNATVKGDKIYCTVSDNGVGMSKQLSERLFDLYFRGGNVRNGVNLGLGLYLCRQIITAHGGEIGVESAPGAGATFWFTLPQAMAS
jgi:PAS domain S-box-containing protein